MHNVKVLYYAYKEGLGLGVRPLEQEQTELVDILSTPPDSPKLTRFEAFKKFYESVAMCTDSNDFMTDPVIASNGHCYQRGYGPDLLFENEAEEERSNRTLKTALEEINLKPVPTEKDYVEFFESVAFDAINQTVAIDPILDDGCIRSESMMAEYIKKAGQDFQGNGTRWENEFGPPDVCFRYTDLQKAIYQLKLDLDPKDNQNASVLEEINACALPQADTDVIVDRRSCLQPRLHHRMGLTEGLAEVISRDPVLKKQVIKHDINRLVRYVSETAVESPFFATVNGASLLGLIALISAYAGFAHLYKPYLIFRNDKIGPYGPTYLEQELGVSLRNQSLLKHIKMGYGLVYIACAMTSWLMLSSTGLNNSIISRLPLVGNSEQNQASCELYFGVSYSIAIASFLTSYIVSAMLKCSGGERPGRHAMTRHHSTL